MKNILLALASFLVTYALLFQTAYAADDGWPPRDEKVNPPAAGEPKTDELRPSGTTEAATTDVIGMDCPGCAAHASNVAITKKTGGNSTSGSAGTPADPIVKKGTR